MGYTQDAEAKLTRMRTVHEQLCQPLGVPQASAFHASNSRCARSLKPSRGSRRCSIKFSCAASISQSSRPPSPSSSGFQPMDKRSRRSSSSVAPMRSEPFVPSVAEFSALSLLAVLAEVAPVKRSHPGRLTSALPQACVVVAGVPEASAGEVFNGRVPSSLRLASPPSAGVATGAMDPQELGVGASTKAADFMEDGDDGGVKNFSLDDGEAPLTAAPEGLAAQASSSTGNGASHISQAVRAGGFKKEHKAQARSGAARRRGDQSRFGASADRSRESRSLADGTAMPSLHCVAPAAGLGASQISQ
mmetsp:Transcript_18657/g.51169  ORF Transcript_18657/g.51169 Transcript_18657/m.51169 type:complete len:304 (-) Transcript_18657:468-1379(-)